MINGFIWTYIATDVEGYLNVYNSRIYNTENEALDEVARDVEQAMERSLTEMLEDGTVVKWNDDPVYEALNGYVQRRWVVMPVSDTAGADAEFHY
jgi:hypothetical protein